MTGKQSNEHCHSGGAGHRVDPRRHRLRVFTNLPEHLPVLPAEVALISAWWPTFRDAIIANDNDEPVPQGERE